MRTLGAILDTLVGLWLVGLLMVRARLRARPRYWRWRLETAMGERPWPSRVERARAGLAYARWVARMRRQP